MLGSDIDFRRLMAAFQSSGRLVRATTIVTEEIRPLIDWLDHNGCTVVTKATKEFVDASGRRKVNGSMNIELAVDAFELVDYMDDMVLFSSHGGFCSLVRAVQRRGVRVTDCGLNHC